MTYAAEPYAQFVDDLLSALTGGEVREQFRFLPELEPFKLAASGAVLPASGQTASLAGTPSGVAFQASVFCGPSV